VSKVEVLYTKFTDQLSEYKFKKLLNRLPVHLQEKNAKFLRWQDRQANLFGKLLVHTGLKEYGYDPDCLKLLQIDLNGRPYIDANIDFNISHSNNYVLCAISKTTKVGIDIEKITPIDFYNFDEVMTDKQINTIKNAQDALKTFFNYWTIKESVVKADGRGLEIPLLDIIINTNTATYNQTVYHINNLNIDQNYSCNLATKSSDLNLKLKYIDINAFNKLL